MEWLRIDEKKPEEGQLVWYWFEVFQEIYIGKYSTVKNEYKGNVTYSDCFHDSGGWLTDDVTYWMPGYGGMPRPEPPTIEQRKKCIYHPLE